MEINRGLSSVHIKEFFSHLPGGGINQLLKRKNLFFKKNVLEIGCGNANTISELNKNYPINAYALDRNKPAHDITWKNIRFFICDLKDIDNLYVMNLKFDFIFSFRVFLHLDMETRINTTEFIMNSLNPGGIAIIDYTGNYSEFRFDFDEDDNYLIMRLNEKKSDDILIRCIEKVYYRIDSNLVSREEKDLVDSTQIAFIGNILVIERKVK